jgi:hypothetical protein
MSSSSNTKENLPLGRAGCVSDPITSSKTRRTDVMCEIRAKIGQRPEPATKRRKLGTTQAFGSQPTESSFADVLQRLKDEAGDGIGMSQ